MNQMLIVYVTISVMRLRMFWMHLLIRTAMNIMILPGNDILSREVNYKIFILFILVYNIFIFYEKLELRFIL